MKIIKKQNKFKVQSLLEMDNPKKAMIGAFWETMSDILSNDDISRVNINYSVLSTNLDRNLKEDPDVNFKKMLRMLDDEGWDAGTLSAMFSKHGDEMADDYNNTRDLPFSPTGMTDYFMYKMTKGKIILMGYNTTEIEDAPGDEAFFKFYYGYNKTPYGKLAMAQHFGSLDKFYDYLGENFVNFLKTDSAKKYNTNAASLITAVNEEYGINDLSQYYDYDKGTNVGTLDLKAAGINLDSDKELRARQSRPMSKVDVNGNRSVDPDYEIESAADMKKVLLEFLSSSGLPLKGTNRMLAGGHSEINDGVVKLYFGS